MLIHVLVKSLTKQKPEILPQPLELQISPQTTRELLDETVKACVREFREQRTLFACLTGDEIEAMSLTGKVSFGGHNGGDVDLVQAMNIARQCFDDGMVRVIVDDKPLQSLDETIDISESSIAVFISLTMLSGRYW